MGLRILSVPTSVTEISESVENKRYSRIVSAVPSLTELLYSLWLGEEVVGITKFCVHPQAWFMSKTKVGGTKKLNKNVIEQLKPDLIIANKEENVKEQIETLAKEFDVLLTDIKSLDDALASIIEIGRLTGKEIRAKEIAGAIKESFAAIPTREKAIRATYLIWREPYMTVGQDTFINDIMKWAGFSNAFDDKHRYPKVSIEEIKQSGSEVILLSSEPYPFRKKHIEELKQNIPDIKAVLTDGAMFSWYGSRLLVAPKYLSEFI